MIDVRKLSFTYPSAQAATLHDLDFHVESGKVLGFLGPNGAGKSTTQKILIGLLRGYTGEVSIMGRSLGSYGSDYYEQVGVSFERPNHFLKLTALENLSYFRSLYRGETEDPRKALEMVGLEGDADRYVGQFSKGMQIRLNIARALLNKPKLLFLDEPTTGLDPVNARVVKERIRELRDRGTTIFLTTHNMSVADEVCDHVAFIVDGRIRLIDSPRALKLRYGAPFVRIEYGSNSTIESRDFPMPGLGDNQEFLQLVRRDDLQTIHTQETTLENIFIQVTGRPLS
jgi:fluoroquinolone transport system ATP-binding protein